MPVAIRSDERLRGRQRAGPDVRLGHRGGADAAEPSAAAARLPRLVEVDEAHEADAEARREDRREADEAQPPAVVVERSGVSAPSTGSIPAESTSQSRNSEDAGRRRAEQRADAERQAVCSRPAGKPRKIVKPAIAPRTRICVEDRLMVS